MNNQHSNRLATIETLSKTLKKKFIGLDFTIDQILEQITPWFVYQIPRETPLIINIWGITGTGKTELVSDICNGLALSTTFHDSQEFMSSSHGLGESDFKSLRTLNNHPQAIIIDEFHRLKTKDVEVKDSDGRYRLWELLTGNIKITYSFEEMLNSVKRSYFTSGKYSTTEDDEAEITPGSADKKFIKRCHFDFYDKAFYYCNYSLSEEMELEYLNVFQKNRNKTFSEYFRDLTVFVSKLQKIENINTKNHLIFVMGNLDAAYQQVVEDIESLEADELSETLSKITAQECKEALLSLFAPEQVARLGANHLVMPTLTKASYHGIINKKIKSFCDLYEKNFDITLVFDDSVRNMIYDQIVVPSQGMRNVLSGFNVLIDTPVSKMIGQIIPYKNHPVFVSFKESSLNFEVGVLSFKKIIDLPKRTNLNTPEWSNQIAHHEAGHALVYYLLRGESPVKVVIETSTNGAAGYIKKKAREFINKQDLKDDVMVAFGGFFAEKIIFGEDSICTGSYGDLKSAASKIHSMINTLGMGSKLIPHRLGSQFEAPFQRTLEKEKDKEIQTLFESLAKETEKLVMEHKNTLEKLATWLLEKKTVSQEEMDGFMKSILTKEEDVVDSIFSNLMEHSVEEPYEIRHLDKLDKKEIIDSES